MMLQPSGESHKLNFFDSNLLPFRHILFVDRKGTLSLLGGGNAISLSDGIEVLESLVGDNRRGTEPSSGPGGRHDLHAGGVDARSLGCREGLRRERRALQWERLTQHGRLPPGRAEQSSVISLVAGGEAPDTLSTIESRKKHEKSKNENPSTKKERERLRITLLAA